MPGPARRKASWTCSPAGAGPSSAGRWPGTRWSRRPTSRPHRRRSWVGGRRKTAWRPGGALRVSRLRTLARRPPLAAVRAIRRKGIGVVNGQNGKRRATATKAEPAEAAAAVGGYVNAACGKCKAMTSHIVPASRRAPPARMSHLSRHARLPRDDGDARPRRVPPSQARRSLEQHASARGATVLHSLPSALRGRRAPEALELRQGSRPPVQRRCARWCSRRDLKLIMGAGSTSRPGGWIDRAPRSRRQV
jgi:hypothetical protein